MRSEFNFRKALLATTLVVSVGALGAWGFGVLLVKAMNNRPLATAPSSAEELSVAAVDDDEEELPTEKPETAPPYEAFVFTAEAQASTEGSPSVRLLTQVAPPGKCQEPAHLDDRMLRSARGGESVSVQAQKSWCLRLAPNQNPVAEPMGGEWALMNGLRPGLESSQNYIRVRHASGKWLGIRAAALAYCVDAAGPCSAGAIVEVGVDDRHMTAPLPLRGRTEVLRLLNGEELQQSRELLEPRSSSEDDDEASASDDASSSSAPASAGLDGYERL